MPADIRPATATLADIVGQIRDEQLKLPTPCGGIAVGALLDHVDSLCVAFGAAATKTRLDDGGRAPVPDATRLGDDWRERITARLDDLAQAWKGDEAWEGTTEVGGNQLPAAAAAAAVIDEVIVHGWDLAIATGQRYPGDDPALTEAMTVAYRWVNAVVGQNPHGSPGLFGPPVPVAQEARLFDRLLGLTGRDPAWQPA